LKVFLKSAFGDPSGTKETFWKKFLWTLQKLLLGLRHLIYDGEVYPGNAFEFIDDLLFWGGCYHMTFCRFWQRSLLKGFAKGFKPPEAKCVHQKARSASR